MKTLANPTIFDQFSNIHARVFFYEGKQEPRLILPHQVHGADICEVVGDGSANDCDALITKQTGWQLGMRVADCSAILLYDPVTKSTAAVHAGWRGAKAEVLPKTIKRLHLQFGVSPSNLYAYISPAARDCCYEVEAKFAGQFSLKYSRVKDGKHYVDVPRLVYDQLMHAGVPPSHIEQDPRCTIHDDTFPSHRRTGSPDRMVVSIQRTR